ncbi:HAMP domain-containing sensor histidine kinase [Ammoniphilus sp. CFH 90114]|uniref:sensor histidine kinase n=1 Tax=Ammoniphilus sp. CFH 90114 TaxID=2493665 RepID=UPI00100E9154|nr:HAMP domain-containing sensor histidine kinase [Ammoniphilus sp. CFH 90114]RXT06365.1 HAMP domain-containing histidine kinase [Ammoniphilus sp. CFH 90114]
MRWVHKTLFRRLMISYLVTVLLGLGVVGLSITWFTKGHLYERTQEELVRKAKRVNLAIQHTSVPNESTVELLAFFDQSFDNRIWVFNREGEIIATSMKDEVFLGKAVSQRIASTVLTGKDILTELEFEGLNKPMLSVVVPWGKKDHIYGGIVLHAPVEGMAQTVNYIRETILWATLFGVIFSTAIVSYISWSISRPLRKIERTTSEIERGNYHQRVHIEHPAEIADLAETINCLAEKLEQVENTKRSQEKVRNDFLTNISHELRTPLTAMQGFLEALQDGLVEDEDTRLRYYQIMYQETLQVNRLVDDLMELIKLQNKDVTLYKTPVQIDEVIHIVVQCLSKEAEDKGTRLKSQIEPNLPTILADPDRLIQILKNLATNAIKFTEKGSVTIEAKQMGQHLQIQVVDTGMGIREEDLERIWERFFKGDRVRSKTIKGTGLGLAIVKELVEMHDGEISVKSKVGEGTTFTFSLPIVEI